MALIITLRSLEKFAYAVKMVMQHVQGLDFVEDVRTPLIRSHPHVHARHFFGSQYGGVAPIMSASRLKSTRNTEKEKRRGQAAACENFRGFSLAKTRPLGAR